MMNLATLAHIVTAATMPHSPSFYRDLYGMSGSGTTPTLPNWEAWHAMPCVTREKLESTPALEHIFGTLSSVDFFSASSGTGGKPPLFSPRGVIAGYEYRAEWYAMEGPFLSGIHPPHRVQFMLQLRKRPARVVTLDPNNLHTSLRLAAAAGVDGMYVPVFLAAQIAEQLQTLGANKRVQFVELSSGPVPNSLIRKLREIFPDAVLCSSWGMTDIDASPMGIPCRPLAVNEQVVYHLKEDIHMDIVDPDTLAPLPLEAGSEGELLLTSYPESAAFPLIRYRTGDIGRIVETSCKRHSRPIFAIVGRAESDFIKVPGGVLRADEVARVLAHLDPALERFELHLYQTDTPSGIRYRAVLHVDAPDTELTALARSVALSLRIGPSFTYADGERDGRLEPLRCVSLVPSAANKKNRRMVAHPIA